MAKSKQGAKSQGTAQKKSGGKAGGYNQNKKTRTNFLDTAFDHMKPKRKKRK